MMTPSRVIQETARMRTNELIREAGARSSRTGRRPARRRSAWATLVLAVRARRAVSALEPRKQAAPCG